MLNSLKMKKSIIFIILLGSIISCEKEDGFWNLKRENNRDLLNNKVLISDLVHLDFNISNITSNSFDFNITHSLENDGLEVIEKGICYNKTGMPDINQNKTAEYKFGVNGIEMNTQYYVRAYAKLNNTSLGDNDIKKYVTIYTGQKTITTKYELCSDFSSEVSLKNSGWLVSNFWVTSNPTDNLLSNDWISTGTSSMSQTFYNLPSNISLNFFYGDNWGDLDANQNIIVKINNVLAATLLQSGFVSIPLPTGNCTITITANDNNSSSSILLGDLCIK
jgi:hypothetical protein